MFADPPLLHRHLVLRPGTKQDKCKRPTYVMARACPGHPRGHPGLAQRYQMPGYPEQVRAGPGMTVGGQRYSCVFPGHNTSRSTPCSASPGILPGRPRPALHPDTDICTAAATVFREAFESLCRSSMHTAPSAAQLVVSGSESTTSVTSSAGCTSTSRRSARPSIRAALNDIARAHSVTELAHETGMTCVGIYKALPPDGNLTFSTLMRITRALGVPVRVTV